MLDIVIRAQEKWDERTQEFLINPKDQHLQLEHSLISLSKWESKWHKPFLNKNDKTEEELIDYIRCMTLTPNVSENVYIFLTKENLDRVGEYINNPMTATTFGKSNQGKVVNREKITSELVYYWMIALNIPFECQKWHLNRLFTLIEVCNRKNAPSKKMNQNSIMSRNAALNNARRAQMNSRG